jgi:hypothetical protein
MTRQRFRSIFNIVKENVVHRQIALSSMLFAALFAASAQAQSPVSIQITVAAGGGLLDTQEILKVQGTAIVINLPRRGTVTPINAGEISFNDVTYDDCQVTSALAADPSGCVITLSCQDDAEQFVIVPGDAGVGSVNSALLTQGQIVTQCLFLPRSTPIR